MNLDLGLLRYRASAGMILCSGEHSIHRSDDGHVMWMQCDGVELDRLELGPPVGSDWTAQIQLFTERTIAEHERKVSDEIVIELLNRLEQDAVRSRDALTAARDFITGHPAVSGEWPMLVGVIDKALAQMEHQS